jgi:hypothetical protein
MSAKVITRTQHDLNASALLDLQAAINTEVDIAWAIKAMIEVMLERDPDSAEHGALQVALEHAHKLEDIKSTLEKVRASAA